MSTSYDVLILGGTGMLGSMIVQYLSSCPNIRIAATYRGNFHKHSLQTKMEADWYFYDPEDDLASFNVHQLPRAEYIVNAIGITSHIIKSSSCSTLERVLLINSIFPHRLDTWASKNGAKVIQIGTDCVFNGEKGNYDESAPHDPHDVYGKTKSLGEPSTKTTLLLRCSIIGPEYRGGRYLLDWFCTQSPGSTVRGFTNHLWNGLTTLQFAKICEAVVRKRVIGSGLHHLIPGGAISKYHLLLLLQQTYEKHDVSIVEYECNAPVNRTLSTQSLGFNEEVWRSCSSTGSAPTISAMIEELSHFTFVTSTD